MSNDTDIVIIGGGHNGLVCAWYLARKGYTVTVLERRDVVGGAAVTEEFHPGFRNSVASYTVSLLNPKVIRDLDLPRHGLKVVHRKMSNFLPLDKKQYLCVGGSSPDTYSEVAKFSQKDADQLDAYGKRLDVIADVLRELVLATPPNMVEGSFIQAIPELLKSATIGKQLSNLDTTAKRDLLALFSQSAGDWLDGWFESDPIKAAYGFDGVVGAFASPYTPGTAYVLLHHVFGEVNGVKGAWGHAIGGMGAITQAMASACSEAGVKIRTGESVSEVLVEHGRAVGVVTGKGETIRAEKVVSNIHPQLLFQKLVDPAHLPADFNERMTRYRSGSATFRMNVALSELPKFSCLPKAGDHLTAGIIIAPSLDYMEKAYFDARRDGWSKDPIVEMVISSTMDDTLAPKGKHVASLFCQHVQPTLSGGRKWEDHRDEVADLMINTVDKMAPGFAKSVVGRMALTPMDLETKLGLVGGDIFHGQLGLDQLFSARPTLGHGNYRAPIKGLYLCGAGTHPGGGVTGAPGHNAAREIIKDGRG